MDLLFKEIIVLEEIYLLKEKKQEKEKEKRKELKDINLGLLIANFWINLSNHNSKLNNF